MPTYEYRCVSCEHQFERFQRMSDEPVKVCEVCGEPVKRLLFPVAIQFKGNGFYTTDYARRSALGSGGPDKAANEPDKAAKTDSDSASAGSSGASSDGSSGNGKSQASEVGAAASTDKSD